MPTFYMIYHSGEDIVRDPEGSIYPSKDAVLAVAYSAAKEMVSHMILGDQMIGSQHIEITDENGAVQGTIRLRDVIKFV